MNNKTVLPVIHHLDYSTTIDQATLALSLGADGVFLISHGADNDELFEPACVIKGLFPTKRVGVNLLGMTAEEALKIALNDGLDMVWADSCGVSSEGVNDSARNIASMLKGAPDGFEFFGSVAFKYQRNEAMPDKAALFAAELGMIPTTSGQATGSAPEINKIVSMRSRLHNHPLAVASGMAPDNVEQFMPYVTHFLVATGVSLDFHHFHKQNLESFINIVHGITEEALSA